MSAGTITLGGQDLKKIPLPQLYDQVAFVSQDNYLFDESVRENIRMGRPTATDQEVEAVAKAAGATISFGPWNRAMTPSWAEAAPTSPAASGSA